MLPGCLSSISRYHNRWQVSGLAEVDWKFFTTWLAITYVCDCRKYIVENRIFVGTDIRWILWWLFYFFLSLSQRWEASGLSEGTSSVWSSVLHLCFFFLAIPIFFSTDCDSVLHVTGSVGNCTGMCCDLRQLGAVGWGWWGFLLVLCWLRGWNAGGGVDKLKLSWCIGTHYFGQTEPQPPTFSM